MENLQKELSEAEIHEETGSIIAKMNGIYYEVDENEEIWILDAKTEKKLTIICIDSDKKEIAQKEYTILKSNYSLTAPKIEDYEPEEEKLIGEISENKEIKVTYNKIFDDDTELVFTGLNSSGAITTVESEIVSYMVGDGTTTNGNGLKEKNKKGILKIPETYKGKMTSTGSQRNISLTTDASVRSVYHNLEIEFPGLSRFTPFPGTFPEATQSVLELFTCATYRFAQFLGLLFEVLLQLVRSDAIARIVQ